MISPIHSSSNQWSYSVEEDPDQIAREFLKLGDKFWLKQNNAKEAISCYQLAIEAIESNPETSQGALIPILQGKIDQIRNS